MPSPGRIVDAPAEPVRESLPLANLDELVARIPVATRKALDELLRARFTRVRRLREGELR